MEITQFVLRRALTEVATKLADKKIFSLAEPTNLILPSQRISLSPEILEMGGRVEDWGNDSGEYYLDFPGKKFEAGVILKKDDTEYCLVNFSYNQRIIAISPTEVKEVTFDWNDHSSKINQKLIKMAYEEILLALP